MLPLQLLFLIQAIYTCCNAQKYYVVSICSGETHLRYLHGIYELVPADDGNEKFGPLLQVFAPEKEHWNRKIDKYYKHMQRYYYLIFFTDERAGQCVKNWHLIDLDSKKCRIDQGIFVDPLIQKSDGRTDIISIDSVVQNAIHPHTEMTKKLMESIHNLSLNFDDLSSRHNSYKRQSIETARTQLSIIERQQKNEQAQNEKIRMQSNLLIEKVAIIQNLTKRKSGDVNILQQPKIEISETESRRESSGVYIIIISILGLICMVLMIVTGYYYASTKMEKDPVHNTSFDGMKPEPQFRPQIVLKPNRMKRNRVKGEGVQTVLGRFEPERFSDAINNLAVVQDAVIDEIIDEMETEEGRYTDPETAEGPLNN